MKHPRASSGPGAEVRKPCSISMNTKKNTRCKCGVQTPACPGKGPCLGEAPRRLAAERRRLGECCCWVLLTLLATEAILPCGGDQVLQRPHNTPTHTAGVAQPHGTSLRSPPRLKLAQAKAPAAGHAGRGGGCPSALWKWRAELGPKGSEACL